MRHLVQTRTLPPSGLVGEAEAEAEGSHDVVEVLRNLALQVQPGETVSQELGFRHGKLTLAQAYGQAMGAAQLQNVSEMLNMRS